MRKYLLAIITTGAVIAGVYYFFFSSDIVDMTKETVVHVVLTEQGYEPRKIRVTKGTLVEFSTTRPNRHWPASNTHPAHDIFPEFDPRKPLEPDEQWGFTFDRLGTWHFHDHVRSYFTGTIYVVN